MFRKDKMFVFPVRINAAIQVWTRMDAIGEEVRGLRAAVCVPLLPSWAFLAVWREAKEDGAHGTPYKSVSIRVNPRVGEVLCRGIGG
jgi:hypothetical protein